MAKMNPLVIGAIVLVAAYALGYINIGGVTTPAAPADDGGDDDECISTTTPNLDVLCRDIENTGTAVTCTMHYIVNGDGVIQTDADATNIALDSKDNIEYYVNATGWYGVHGTYNVPCKEEPRLTILMKDYGVSPTNQFFAEDDGLLMSSSANSEAVAAGDTPVLEYRYYANVEDYVQDANFFCQFDKTYYDTVLFNGEKGSGRLVPVHFSTGLGLGETGQDSTSGGWSLGDLKGTTAQVAFVTFDTDDTNDATGFNVSCYLEDQDWYINEDAGIFEYGMSDENDADVAQTTAWTKNITMYTG